VQVAKKNAEGSIAKASRGRVLKFHLALHAAILSLVAFSKLPPTRA
jgi:hypothetical protein